MRKKESLVILCAAIAFRLIIYFFSALLMAMQSGGDMSLNLDSFLINWTKWDAGHYIKIAESGYEGAIENGQHIFLVFFPLFPYLMKAFSIVTGNTALAGMVLSTLAYGGGCIYVYRIGEKYAGKEGGRNLALLIAAYPFSFFFGGIMTESLFLLVSAATLYYIGEHKWMKAILFGALATMTRLQGVLLGIPALVEAFVVYRPDKALKSKQYKQIWLFIGRCASFLIMLSGVLYYLWINYRIEGNPFRFMYYQETHWGQGEGNILHTIAYLFRYSFEQGYDLTTRVTLWMPQMVLVLVSVLFLLTAYKKIRPMYYFYGAGYIYLTFSVPWLLSGSRYFACNIPLFLLITVMGRNKKYFVVIITAIFGMLQMIYLSGFFQNLPIM